MTTISTWKRDIIREAERLGIEGITISSTGGAHLRVELPSGQSIFCSSSPSDHRAIYKVRSLLRRYSREAVS